ncbi:ABC-2 type transporter [Artemisia annua]|uniref:ABC-2 type transporter n=1 Tax=Artemisia annua TaxID=35608 RepID=A0A2U1P5Y5_ARTAN|nr:ABC-2 type transporter [Artemisia annua]
MSDARFQFENPKSGFREWMPLDFQAYVTQDDDNLIGTLTIRETISYSAILRLPDKMPWSDKRALVESAIVEMGLQDCADTLALAWY